MRWFSLLALLGCGGAKHSPSLDPTQPPLHDPVGDWAGNIELPNGAGLPFVLHITTDETGALTGTADSPQQGATGIPLTEVVVSGGDVLVEVASVRGSFSGTFSDANTLSGTWKQSVARLPLTLVRDAEIEAPARPQMPQEPFPYTDHDMVIDCDTHTLAGTLSIPDGEGPFPGVVLISGSGPQDRDETIMEHKPFWVLADHLARNGIAVLRYDDRGVAESTGDFSTATSMDLGSDASAVLSALRDRPEIAQAGLIGHSEGGLIAPLIATESAPDFLVLMAPPAVPIVSLMLAQSEAVAKAAGTDAASLEAMMPIQEQLYATAQQGDSPENRARAQELLLTVPGADAMDEAAQQAQINALFSPWMVWFLQYDPTESLQQVTMPVLALWGDRDVQVLSAQNAPAFAAATADNPQATVHVFEGLNHLFQPAETGSVTEYAQIETTIDPQVLRAISQWVTETTAPVEP